ncbi:kelch-like protein 24 isoform X1 [Petromyzon marinus]|uniref:kelch-like protein 24 isoform X1 n=1 Tax=Petromyzon marinus TaxID=7757 RepID=UPI003F6EBFA4
MVLILGRRNARAGAGESARESPASKRKVLNLESKTPGGTSASELLEFSAGSPHAEGVLAALNEFRLKDRIFTDVMVAVEGCEFPCHRAVLSACSAYFRAMFCNDHRESRATIVEINGIQASAMEQLLQYMYTGRARITTDNVQYLFETASLFQIHALRSACAKFLEEQLDPCNVLGLQRFADAHSLQSLHGKCAAFALQRFCEVVQHQEFLELPKDELVDYVSSDELVVDKEETVFEAVMRWVQHNAVERRSALRDVLDNVRLPLLQPDYFVQTVEGEEMVRSAPECYGLLHEARRFHVLGNEMCSSRTRPRRSTGCSEVIVIVGGCERVGGFNLPYTECYDPITGEWTSLSKLPEFTKSEYAVCALRNDILVSGGRINSRDVWMYNSQLNVWVRVASLAKGRWRHKMAVLHGKVYAVGGYDGQTRLSSVECYDSFANRWTDVAPLKEAVSSPAVASCSNRLYVIGGGPDDNTCSDKVQCYDPVTNTWLLRSSIPIAKRCISAVCLNNLIYVSGGLTNNIFCYDPLEDYWMNVATTFSKQESCGMTVCNGKIFILGGKSESGEAMDTVLCYDPGSGILTGVAAMPRPICYHGCVSIHRYHKH